MVDYYNLKILYIWRTLYIIIIYLKWINDLILKTTWLNEKKDYVKIANTSSLPTLSQQGVFIVGLYDSFDCYCGKARKKEGKSERRRRNFYKAYRFI